MSERLSTTIKHFKDGITKVGLSAARKSIESWQTELKDYDGTAFKTIATDLGHLHDELGKDEIDGAKVGKLMTKLGKETVKCGKEAGDKASDVKELGELIERAAGELAGEGGHDGKADTATTKAKLAKDEHDEKKVTKK